MRLSQENKCSENKLEIRKVMKGETYEKKRTTDPKIEEMRNEMCIISLVGLGPEGQVGSVRQSRGHDEEEGPPRLAGR